MQSYSSRELIQRLKNEGWFLVAVEGSHHQFKHPTKTGKVTVPHPRKGIPKKTLKNIFKQAEWNE